MRFPTLDLKLWSKRNISRIVIRVGNLLHMDKATATGERLSYARVFVEVKAYRILPNKVSQGSIGRRSLNVS